MYHGVIYDQAHQPDPPRPHPPCRRWHGHHHRPLGDGGPGLHDPGSQDRGRGGPGPGVDRGRGGGGHRPPRPAGRHLLHRLRLRRVGLQGPLRHPRPGHRPQGRGRPQRPRPHPGRDPPQAGLDGHPSPVMRQLGIRRTPRLTPGSTRTAHRVSLPSFFPLSISAKNKHSAAK